MAEPESPTAETTPRLLLAEIEELLQRTGDHDLRRQLTLWLHSAVRALATPSPPPP